jgi:hypothetical protein
MVEEAKNIIDNHNDNNEDQKLLAIRRREELRLIEEMDRSDINIRK